VSREDGRRCVCFYCTGRGSHRKKTLAVWTVLDNGLAVPTPEWAARSADHPDELRRAHRSVESGALATRLDLTCTRCSSGVPRLQQHGSASSDVPDYIRTRGPRHPQRNPEQTQMIVKKLFNEYQLDRTVVMVDVSLEGTRLF
jgi:hypothetical protein